MKKLIVLSSIIALNGCFIYSAKDDCIYGLVSNQCFGEEYSVMAHYQKPHSLGKTDHQQRLRDDIFCTKQVKFFREKDGKLIMSSVQKYINCMKGIGYIFIDDCGRKNSTTDKGVCNE